MVLIFFNLIWSLYENILLNGIYGTSANIFWDFVPLAKIISINQNNKYKFSPKYFKAIVSKEPQVLQLL